MKAKFIDKWYGTGYDRNMVYLEYEYRGERYTVTENMAKGNEPLAWQHKSEQARIDRIIDMPKTSSGHNAWDDFCEWYNMMEYGELD